MNPSEIPQVKRIIRATVLENARALIDEVFQMKTATEIRRYLEEKQESLIIEA